MKKFQNSIFIAFIAVITFIGFDSCKKTNDNVESMKSIVEIVTTTPKFSTLAAALTKAGLVNTINQSPALTVFAPTNDAFNALFAQLKVSGLNDLSAETLKPILLYHVLGSKVTSSQIASGYTYTLSPGLGAKNLVILLSTQGGVKINKGTSVTQADMMATNGVIHVIDKVLLPNSVVDIASNNDNFSTLVAALVKADLVNTLSGSGPFTIFAPTNDAFQELFTLLKISGINDLTKEQLTPILLYHVVSGNILSSNLSSGNVTTLNPATISIMVGTAVTINSNTTVTAVDVQGTNGVIHVINKVLLPPAK